MSVETANFLAAVVSQRIDELLRDYLKDKDQSEITATKLTIVSGVYIKAHKDELEKGNIDKQLMKESVLHLKKIILGDC